mgnify:FL=1
MKIEDVNKPHSNTWTRINDDSKKGNWRKKFLEEFGGEFIPKKRGIVEWKESEPQEIPQEIPVVKPRERIFSIINPKGDIDEVKNFTKYCRENKLSRSAMYEVMKGTRKQHKGYTAKGD